ncbi:MAG: cytochrome c biogenesis protein CcdA [Chloroflexi bacterium]|nr:cytochrome c biogenesis protein CcdA [Chloroflexota bacterium]
MSVVPGSRSTRGPWLSTALSYGLPGLAVAVLIGVLISLQANAEAAVSEFAGALPIGFAAAAGVVASVNPCGFFMLPGYVAYQLGTQEAGYDQLSGFRRVSRALAVGLMATLGFVLIFAAVGAVIAAGGTFLSRVFPFLGLSVGVLMVIFGGYLLITHRYIGVLAASRIQVTPQRNLGNAFVFGLGYAVGSLSCTLPIFLVVVGGALGAAGFLASFSQFLAFALGMGVVVIAVTIGAAIFRDAVARFLRGALPHVHRASSLFLVGAGGYLIYYWVFFAGLNL